jgi:hypothetical protein
MFVVRATNCGVGMERTKRLIETMAECGNKVTWAANRAADPLHERKREAEGGREAVDYLE